MIATFNRVQQLTRVWLPASTGFSNLLRYNCQQQQGSATVLLGYCTHVLYNSPERRHFLVLISMNIFFNTIWTPLLSRVLFLLYLYFLFSGHHIYREQFGRLGYRPSQRWSHGKKVGFFMVFFLFIIRF